MNKNPKIDALLRREKRWHDEFEALRAVALGCGLTEEMKWGQACYTDDGKNIVLIHGFKEYCALLFMKGALLKDPKHILIQQTPHVQSGRQIRFTNLAQIRKMTPVLKAYMRDAIGVEKKGLKVTLRKTSDYKVPKEFQKQLDAMPPLRAAFESLTPGRQRGYLFYFSSAKQSKTREERVEKYTGKILDGLGLDD